MVSVATKLTILDQLQLTWHLDIETSCIGI